MPKLNNSDFHLPYNPKPISIAKQMRQNPTPAEKKLWQNYLRHFSVRVLRQRPIDNFIVDFYCASLKLAIEIDGESHFTEEGKHYDRGLTKRKCKNPGLVKSLGILMMNEWLVLDPMVIR